MIDTFAHLVWQSVTITLLVAVMMIVVDVVNIYAKQNLTIFLRHTGPYRQYIVSSLIGTIPGCVGGFTNVSLYMHGMISFGALTGSMIAASGDEAFVMLALFPEEALILFGALCIIGMSSGWLIDRFIRRFTIPTREPCKEMIVHISEKNILHYLKDHLWSHIIRRHLFKIASWTFGTLLLVEIGLNTLPLEQFTSEHMFLMLLLGGLIGLIPESGPHLIFVTLFAQGLIPFSVLLTSSIVQDGHSMLPMLSYSLRDTISLKMINLIIGLSIGGVLYSLGM